MLGVENSSWGWAVFSAIRERDGVDGDVIMDMAFVHVGADHNLVISAHYRSASSRPMRWARSGVTSPGTKV